MDEPALPTIHVDGSRAEIILSVGAAAEVYCDRSRPPNLVIETPTVKLIVEPARVDSGAARVARDLAAAVATYREQVAQQLLERRPQDRDR